MISTLISRDTQVITDEDIIREWIKTEDAYSLCRYYFDWTLTPGQEEIVADIAFERHRRISINCYTRYGKTRCVALGVALFILLNRDKKIAIIAPQADQTDILREYIVECIIRCPQLEKIADLKRTRDIRSLRKEASRRRLTFSNGMEYRVFSAYGEADRLMGFGAHLTVKDEAAKITRPVSAKIFRMTGDAPDDSIIVEITNPWDKDTVAGDHYFDLENWKQIHIDWKQGLAEGRTTQSHIDEARREMSPIEFTVLYDSNYPDESESALLRWVWIQAAIYEKINEIKTELIEVKGIEYMIETIDGVEILKKIIGLDVAEAGRDFTVATFIYKMADGNWIVKDIQYWHKEDTMATVGWLLELNREFKTNEIHVDAIGCGKGVFDRLREPDIKDRHGAAVHGIKVGQSANVDAYRFPNKKVQYFWNLRILFEEGRIKIPKYSKLIKELSSLRYEPTSGGKLKIIDPGKKDSQGRVVGKLKSPDFADSLMLGCANSSGGVVAW